MITDEAVLPPSQSEQRSQRTGEHRINEHAGRVPFPPYTGAPFPPSRPPSGSAPLFFVCSVCSRASSRLQGGRHIDRSHHVLVLCSLSDAWPRANGVGLAFHPAIVQLEFKDRSGSVALVRCADRSYVRPFEQLTLRKERPFFFSFCPAQKVCMCARTRPPDSIFW